MPSQAVCCLLIIREIAQPACELVHTQFNSILFKRLAAVTRRSPASEEGEDQAAERGCAERQLRHAPTCALRRRQPLLSCADRADYFICSKRPGRRDPAVPLAARRPNCLCARSVQKDDNSKS